MSQSPHSADSQALLQSMLQRLKLQSGREGQVVFQAPVSPSEAPALGQNGETGAPSLQEVNSSPVNVFSVYGNPSKELPISFTNSNSGYKSGDTQQPISPVQVIRSPTFFPSQNVRTDGDLGEKNELGSAPRPGFSPTGTRQRFPAKPQKEVKLTFFKRTDEEKESIGSPLMKRQMPAKADAVSDMTQKQNHVPVWSAKSTDPDMVGGENRGFHVGNGGIRSLEQNKDVQVFTSSQITTNTRRKRSSENKSRRWTQKIKERFKDRHVGKKGKEYELPEQETQVIIPETVDSKPSNDANTTISSLDCLDSSRLHPAQTQDNTTVNNNRRDSDIDIGLGSFSLLEEIVKGQQWAKFINPNLSTTSATEKSAEETSSQPHIQQSLNQSQGALNQVGIGSNQWSFGSTESSPDPTISMPRQAPVFPPVTMDTPALKQHTDHSEPMEDGQSRSEKLSKLQLRLSAFIEPSGNPYHSIVRNRMQLSRKRQHQPAEWREANLQTETMSDGEKSDEGSTSLPSSAVMQMMEESIEAQQENIPSSQEKQPHPVRLSPAFDPSAPPPRSVLRHNVPKNSESPLGTLTKRRRVEENRRVRFSEQIVTIQPDYMDYTDSEDEIGGDEDSLFEPDIEAVQAEMDEALPARRSNLPAWIKALKRINAGKKHR